MIVFRTDASIRTGFGHLKRSVYLATLLKKKNKIIFIVNNEKIVQNYLKDFNLQFCLLDNLKVLFKEQIICTVFDIRECSSLDKEMLDMTRERDIFTLQLTDFGLHQLDVNTTIDPSPQKIYAYKESKDLLTGLDYAILHHKFRHFNKIRRKYRKKIKNLFISLGSSVQFKQLRPFVDLVYRHQYNTKLATGFCMKKSNRKIFRRIYPKLRFVGKTDNLARSLFEADIALITPGMLALEAAAVGTPCLYIYANESHKFSGEMYEREGFGLAVSNVDNIEEKGIIEKITSLTWEERTAIGNKGKDLVDGKGVYRVLDFLGQRAILI